MEVELEVVVGVGVGGREVVGVKVGWSMGTGISRGPPTPNPCLDRIRSWVGV